MSEATYDNGDTVTETPEQGGEMQEDQIYYADFDGGFNMVHLESSNVLNIKTTMSFVEIQLELVMTEAYTLYQEPDEEEVYCYRKGRIFFPNLDEVRLFSQICPSINPNGTVDYGNIDGFVRVGGTYYLQGEWGELAVVSEPPLLEIDELKAHQQQQYQLQKQQQAQENKTD